MLIFKSWFFGVYWPGLRYRGSGFIFALIRLATLRRTRQVFCLFCYAGQAFLLPPFKSRLPLNNPKSARRVPFKNSKSPPRCQALGASFLVDTAVYYQAFYAGQSGPLLCV